MPLVAYGVGQGLADHGKEAAKKGDEPNGPVNAVEIERGRLSPCGGNPSIRAGFPYRFLEAFGNSRRPFGVSAGQAGSPTHKPVADVSGAVIGRRQCGGGAPPRALRGTRPRSTAESDAPAWAGARSWSEPPMARDGAGTFRLPPKAQRLWGAPAPLHISPSHLVVADNLTGASTRGPATCSRKRAPGRWAIGSILRPRSRSPTTLPFCLLTATR